jgi:hypothetical protein
MKQTTIKVAGKDYPLYKTMRGVVSFNRSQYGQKDLVKGDLEAILYSLYCMVQGAAIREKRPFDFSFDEFVDQVEPDALEKLSQVNESEDTEPQDDSDTKKKG